MNKKKITKVLFVLSRIVSIIAILLTVVLMFNYNIDWFSGFVVIMLLFLTSAVLTFQLKFRLNTSEYSFNNIEYEAYRKDIEEKISELQKSINKDYEHWERNNHLVLSGAMKNDNLLQQFGVSSNIPVEKNTVFMLMPFNEDAVKVYANCKDTVESLGLTIKKSDDIVIEGDLLRYIVECIIKADYIIANLDGKNPNVFYELGIAHALKKKKILITSCSLLRISLLTN